MNHRFSASVLVALLVGPLVGCAPSSPRPTPQASVDPAAEGLGASIGTPATVSSRDRSPGWTLPGTKIVLTGVVFQPDGVTPASDIVLYYYHTNLEGRYEHRPDEPRSMPPNELGQTHGYLRGWVRTGADGRYAIETVRPAPYPSGDEPAHVHATILEPGAGEYYIDDFVFDDDPLLTPAKRRNAELRGGSGIVALVRDGDVLVGTRDIVLGRNVPNYPPAAR